MPTQPNRNDKHNAKRRVQFAWECRRSLADAKLINNTIHHEAEDEPFFYFYLYFFQSTHKNV